MAYYAWRVVQGLCVLYGFRGKEDTEFGKDVQGKVRDWFFQDAARLSCLVFGMDGYRSMAWDSVELSPLGMDEPVLYCGRDFFCTGVSEMPGVSTYS